jgi:homoserine dehydrogenase
VGGATPLLATAARLREERSVVAFEGVLNGTTNFVLDRLGEGRTLAQAVAEAQSRGFAEADPLRDLDGTDAAEKLALLAAEALGVAVAPEQVETRGVLDVTTGRCVEAARRGQRVRLVASFGSGPDGRRLRVAPREVCSDGWLGGARDEWNAGAFRCGDGSVVRVRGRGAGRGPTAQAALADLLEIRRKVICGSGALAEAVAS